MSATQAGRPFAGYEGAVVALVRAGAPFGEIADGIDEIADLTRDAKAVLRRFAFSLQIGAIQARHTHPHLVVVR
jgi:hypothetical protein